MADEPRTFPQEVHESLATLRAAARAARHRNDADLRWATDDEIALAESERKPSHCTARSSRTGLPCRNSRVLGTTVCRMHGAAPEHVRKAADRRLFGMVNPLLTRLRDLALQDDHRPTAQKAASDLLDRAGVGALVEAKMHQAKRHDGTQLTVHIGFIQNLKKEPVTVEIPASTNADDDALPSSAERRQLTAAPAPAVIDTTALPTEEPAKPAQRKRRAPRQTAPPAER